MDLSPEQIRPERLLEASDAVLEAVVEVAEQFDGLYLHPPQLMGTTLAPLCMREFSVAEIREATQFLVRLGVLPAETPAGQRDAEPGGEGAR